MSDTTIELQAKLYRARAIDEAMALVAESAPGVALTKTREGDLYRVTIDGAEGESARELLSEVADAALVITVEHERH